jgi:hypothetical protein
LPVRDYIGELRVEGNPDHTSTVKWSAEFEPTSGDEAGTACKPSAASSRLVWTI